MAATYLTKMAHTPFNSEMKYETARLASFQNWRSIDRANPIILAKAGFAYTGNEDVVKCSSCNFTKEHWNRHMDPMRIHRENSPNCSFVLGSEEANVPIAVPETTMYREILEHLHNQYCGANAPMIVSMNFSRQTSDSADDSGALDRQNLQAATQTNFPVVATDSGSAETSSQAIGVRGALGHNQASAEPQRREDFSPMKQESNRFLSFVGNWPRHGTPDPRDLARAGFYYTGTVDRVQCVFCRGILRNWDEDDVPMDEHRRHFPMCPFVLGMDVGNTPDPSVIVSDNSSNSTVHITGPEAVVTDSVLGIVTERPKHAQYAVESSRITSFTNWPSGKAQTPAELAKAGFFYAGFGDSVKCFFCDVGLRTWESGDIPWVEHARWSPRCPWVRQVKGDDFIKLAEAGQLPPSVANELNADNDDINIPELEAAIDENDNETRTLLEENKQLKEERVCKICLDQEVSVVFLPCGHLVSCVTCAAPLRKCPVCRSDVKGSVRTYMS